MMRDADLIRIKESPTMFVSFACWFAIALGAAAEETRLPSVSAALDPGRPASVDLPAAPRARTISVLISLSHPSKLPAPAASSLKCTLNLGDVTLTKPLHVGDPDV